MGRPARPLKAVYTYSRRLYIKVSAAVQIRYVQVLFTSIIIQLNLTNVALLLGLVPSPQDMSQEAHKWPRAFAGASERTVDQHGCGSVAMAAVDRGLQVGAS